MLAVHLTVEEGLKLKIAMKGGLREKIRQTMLRNIKYPPNIPILPVLFRFSSHFSLFQMENEDVSKFLCDDKNVFIFKLFNLSILHLDILHLHIGLCKCFEHVHWSSPSILT